MAEQVLDVSDLGPPEPLWRTLAAAEALAQGDYLYMRHRLKPCLLYEQLEQRGYAHATRAAGALCAVFIWRRDDAVARQAAEHAAQTLPPWRE